MEQVPKQSKLLNESVAFEQKWLGIKHITFTNGEKIIQNYEAAYRPKRGQHKFEIDGVEILPIFKRKDKSTDIIMIANFRPPVGKFCLEFPAGMVEGNNFEEDALRELSEQTGYKAQKLLKIPRPITHCDPWKSSQSGILYVAIVNQEDPNHYKKQALQQQENIRVFTFKIEDNLPNIISQFAEKNNYAIHARLWALILGLTFNCFL